MEFRPTQLSTSNSRDPVLLVGPESRLQRALAEELRALHAPVLNAVSMEDAIDQASGFSRSPSGVIVPEAEIQPQRFEETLAELQIRSGSTRLIPIAVGPRPDESRRHALRQAGVRLALFGRFGRHALRFQLNRAFSQFAQESPRGTLRAPMEWRTRTYCLGQRKVVRCYSLSIGGAYFVTPRPWVVGTHVSLELPILGRRRVIEGQILYTKMTASTERPTLPGGMAIRFDSLPSRIENVIQRDLSQTRFGLEV